MVSQLRPSDPFQSQEDITYPDSDGQPMTDNTKQFRWIVLNQWREDGIAPRLCLRCDEEERQRAKPAEQPAMQLAEQLRRMGIDPDQG